MVLLGEAMGLAQHHDAVSGTEKQEVAFDYAMRLADGIDSAVVSGQGRGAIVFSSFVSRMSSIKLTPNSCRKAIKSLRRNSLSSSVN